MSEGDGVMMVSDVAVEKAARALVEDDLQLWDEVTPTMKEFWTEQARSALVAALPVIERELREQIAGELEAMRHLDADRQLRFLAARVREGGRA